MSCLHDWFDTAVHSSLVIVGGIVARGVRQGSVIKMHMWCVLVFLCSICPRWLLLPTLGIAVSVAVEAADVYLACQHNIWYAASSFPVGLQHFVLSDSRPEVAKIPPPPPSS